MHIVIWKDLVRPCMTEHARLSAYTSPALSSKVSPFRGGANALLILFIAMMYGYMWIIAGRVNRRGRGQRGLPTDGHTVNLRMVRWLRVAVREAESCVEWRECVIVLKAQQLSLFLE